MYTAAGSTIKRGEEQRRALGRLEDGGLAHVRAVRIGHYEHVARLQSFLLHAGRREVDVVVVLDGGAAAGAGDLADGWLDEEQQWEKDWEDTQPRA